MAIYLLIDGHNGGSTDPGHLGWFEVSGIEMAFVNSPVALANGTRLPGNPGADQLQVSMEGLAPELLDQLISRTAVSAMRLQEVDAAGTLVSDIRIGEVFVNAHSFGGGAGPQSSRLTLTYERIGVTTPDGSFGFDFRNDIPIDPATLPMAVADATDDLESAVATQYHLLINDGNVAGSGSSKAWFEISSLNLSTLANLGVSISHPRALEFIPLNVEFAGESPDLMHALATRSELSSIQILGTQGTATVFDLRLGDVYVLSGNVGGQAGGSPFSSFSFSYDEIGLITPASSFGFDVSSKVTLDPTTLPSLTAIGPDYVESAPVSTYFLSIDGLNGGALNGSSKGWFEINSLFFGGGAGGSLGPGDPGQASFDDVALGLNGVSAELLDALALGQSFDAARIQGVDGKGAVIYDLKLGDVRLTQVIPNWPDDAAPSTNLALHYGQIGLSTPERSFGFDVTAGASIATGSIPTPTPAGPDVLETSAITRYQLGVNDSKAWSWFEVDTVSLVAGVELLGGGTPRFSELGVNAAGIAPGLLDNAATGTPLESIQIQGLNSANQVVYDLRLGDVRVRANGTSLDGAAGGVASSALSLSYEQIGLITPSGSFGYDLTNNLTLDPTTLPTLPMLTAIGPDSVESAAVSKYFLLIDGMDGGSQNGSTGGWFEIESWQQEMSQDAQLNLVGASAELVGRLATNPHVESIQLQGVDSKGAVVYDLRWGDVVLSSHQTGAGQATPVSSLGFSFGQIALVTSVGSFGHDRLLGTLIDPASIPLPTPAGGDSVESRAAAKFFLSIDGIDGNSTDPARPWAFEIPSLGLGVNTSAFVGSSGPAETRFQGLNVSIPGLALAPDLLAELATGGRLASVRIEGVDADGALIYDLRLGDSLAVVYALLSNGSPFSELTFESDRIGLITPSGSFGFDNIAQVAIDPNDMPVPVFNVAPEVTALVAAVSENAPTFSQDLLAGASDPNAGTTLTVQDLDSTVTTTGGRLLTLGADYTHSGTSLALTAAGFAKFDGLGAGQSDQAVFDFAVSDGLLKTANTLALTIQGVDDAAVLGSADVTVAETNAPISTGGTLSISDVDSAAAFVAQPGTAGQYGVFTLAANGSWTYKASLAYDHLNPGQSLTDTFAVSATDGGTSSVKVSIAGTAEPSVVRLGDAPVAQSGTGGQWALAWTQTGYALSHKADYGHAAEPWSAVRPNAVSSQALSGGDIFGGDLGVSGQSATTSTVRQEIDGREALRITVPTAADSVTIKLSRLFTNDDGTALSEAGLLRLLDAAGTVVAEQAFWANIAAGTQTVTLAAAGGFASMELLAGAYDGSSFVHGAYRSAGGAFGSAIFTDAGGKQHGSDFLLDAVAFMVPLVGVAASADFDAFSSGGPT